MSKSYADSIDLFVDEKQGYPEGLKLYPESYTIELAPEDYHPLSALEGPKGTHTPIVVEEEEEP